DQPIAAVGNGVTQHGSAQSTIGTGGQIFLSLDWPLVDSQLRTHSFCHTAPDRWYLMAATLSAGLSLKWFREQVLQASHDLSYSDL
ncbi:MAG: xylulokinase, partial [Candidatus Latescibacteria bacterium]|nr:xylulokinase [Candidatus Latescibacterota bacterium]